MENLPRNKISMECAAEDNYSSINSPSFADLVCTQDDQQLKPLPASSSQFKQEPEFEFSPAKPNPNTHDLYKNSSADVLVSNNQLQLHEFLGQTKQSHDKKKPLSKGQSPASCDTQCIKVSGEANHKVRKEAKKERTATSSFIGQKLFQLLSPCSECKTIQPTVKTHTVAPDVK